MATPVLPASCCIAGGGPAGMMLALLLARAGVRVVVLEKHADFLRDFRGDTIHPSTLEVLHELGLLEAFLALPHQEVRQLRAWVGDRSFRVAGFGHLPVRCPFIALIPQWDFLDFLAREASRHAGFELHMRTQATGLIEEAGRIVGVRARAPEGPLEVRAALVVAADGRRSVLRADAGLPVQALGAPMDVLWFRLSRRASDPPDVMARFAAGRILVLIERGDYWQCGYVIAKGSIDALRARGIDALRREVSDAAPFLAPASAELRDWDSVSMLSVRVDRARRWYREGFLCIGDAAHAMSPIGGVGINLAIQDAVAAANRLARPLSASSVTTQALRQVQRRRERAAWITQRLQVAAQRRIVAPVLDRRVALHPPLALRLLDRFAVLRRIPGRLIGMGVRPEHVDPGLAGVQNPNHEQR